MLNLKQAERKLYNFAEELVGNRVLDLYLKYMGIKTLTSATLVPVALILGKDAMEQFLNKEVVKQDGGSDMLEEDIVIIDDPLIGNYLKLSGLSVLNLTAGTLVPLGVLMFIYDLYNKEQVQKGGSLNKFIKKTYGNRVLDLFFKYQGLKTLTSATLVPFALIYGKDVLENVLMNEKQTGGFIDEELPFLDDPLLGNYLKLAGVSTISLTTNTLVPLGILAMVYNLYLNEN